MSRWWHDGNSSNSRNNMKNHRTPRMELEASYMTKIFAPGKRTRMVPNVEWDTSYIVESLDLSLNVTEDPDQPYWVLTFRFLKDPDARGRDRLYTSQTFLIKVVYARDHPHSEAYAYPYRREHGVFELFNLELTEHQFADGHLCLWEHGSSRSRGWDPAHSTAGTIMSWSIEWFRAYLYSEKFGEFPETG